jgi:hypothetical protein
MVPALLLRARGPFEPRLRVRGSRGYPEDPDHLCDVSVLGELVVFLRVRVFGRARGLHSVEILAFHFPCVCVRPSLERQQLWVCV